MQAPRLPQKIAGLGLSPKAGEGLDPCTAHHHAPWLSESCPCRPPAARGGASQPSVLMGDGGVCMLLQQGAARSRRAGARGVSSLAVPRPPYLPRTKVGTMDLDRVTLLSALAGQDLVPEQALQVQEADEAGRGSSGG